MTRARLPRSSPAVEIVARSPARMMSPMMNGKVPDSTPAADQPMPLSRLETATARPNAPVMSRRRRFQAAVARSSTPLVSWRQPAFLGGDLAGALDVLLDELAEGVAGQEGVGLRGALDIFLPFRRRPAPSSSGRHRRRPGRRSPFPAARPCGAAGTAGCRGPDSTQVGMSCQFCVAVTLGPSGRRCGLKAQSGRWVLPFHCPMLSLGLLTWASIWPPASCTAASAPLLKGM